MIAGMASTASAARWRGQGYRLPRQALRGRRLELGLSQRDIAEAARIPSQTLSRVERGLLGVSPERQARLAEVLKAPIDGLFKKGQTHPNARRTP